MRTSERTAPEVTGNPAGTGDQKEIFSSNGVRLSGVHWAITAALVLVVCLGLPALWPRVETFAPGPDYRIPYALSNDYWHYARYCRESAGDDQVLVLGDSVVWGEYVAPQDTLVHHLNAQAGRARFVNLGVNGIHPVAMAGLIEYYGRAVSGQDVLLHYNPLWMSSKRHDLQSEKESRFNHPKLVPQFWPRIPCYKESGAKRVGIVTEHYLPFRAWSNHLAVAYFGEMSLTAWAFEHPYRNPLGKVTLALPTPDTALRHEPVPWTEKGIPQANFVWVLPADSFQWYFFQRAVRTLQARGNRLFVLVGPFNEPMLEAESLAVYRGIKEVIEAWLEAQQIPHWVAPPLPSERYADASHPLGEGYA